MKNRFTVGLTAHFLADYALLYLVIARAQAAGGAKGAVWTFLATSLPAVALFALAPLWDRMQQRPLRSMGWTQAVIIAATLALFLANALAGTLAIALALGFTRQLFRLLLSACAKGASSAELRNRILERSITVRYACMIPGATLGAFAGGSHWETVVIGASAAATAVSLLLLQSDRTLAAFKLEHQAASLPQLPNWRMLSQAFGQHELLAFLFTTVAVSSFMAMEYPLLTETYGFQRWMLPVVWGGHLVGSLIASWRKVAVTEQNVARRVPLLFALTLVVIAAFGTFSVLPALVIPAALLMAFATLVLCRFEITAGKRLLDGVGEAGYAAANLQMRGFELALQIVGPALASVGVAALTVRGTLGLVCGLCLLGAVLLARPAAVRAS